MPDNESISNTEEQDDVAGHTRTPMTVEGELGDNATGFRLPKSEEEDDVEGHTRTPVRLPDRDEASDDDVEGHKFTP